MNFTEKEIDIIYNREFLITKTVVMKKIHELFKEVQESLNTTIINSSFTFPSEVDIKIGKIFRGENYKMLPYVNLDYPKRFEANDIFTFRTMFLWGSFFSSTLHLGGKYFTEHKNNILSDLNKYLNSDIYICVNESPWHYHYGSDNYIKLTKDNIHLIETLKFIKLSMKYELRDYMSLPNLSSRYLETCLNILS